MKILIIEDDKKLCDVLNRGLVESGHIVEVVNDGKSGMDYAINASYDLVILDIMLPDISGMDVCRSLRAGLVSSLILMLTAKNTLDDKVSGLNAGADDYLCKPFAFEELEARIHALQRRETVQKSPVIKIGGISLNTVTRDVTANGKKADLTATEYRILEYFMINPNRILTPEMIEEHVWDIETSHEYNAINAFISRLRRKLGFDIRTCPIQNVYGEGYKLVK